MKEIIDRPDGCRQQGGAADEESGRGQTGSGLLARLGRHERLLWGLVVMGVVLDGALTVYGLQQGLVEGNPVVRSAMAQFGQVGGILVVKGVAVCCALAIREAVERNLAPIVPVVVGVLWVAAGVVNLASIVAV